MSYIVIVTTEPPDAWARETADTLRALGPVEFATAAALEAREPRSAEIVIIDATAVAAAEIVVGQLLGSARHADVRIVVMTASPTWQRARGAFEAGATDYLAKEKKGQDLIDAIAGIAASRTGPPGRGVGHGTYRGRR